MLGICDQARPADRMLQDKPVRRLFGDEIEDELVSSRPLAASQATGI